MTNNLTHTEIRAAIDRGHVWVLATNGNYWQVRTNGATKLWKTRPQEFCIPIKAGLRDYGEITHRTLLSFKADGQVDFVISEMQPKRNGKR